MRLEFGKPKPPRRLERSFGEAESLLLLSRERPLPGRGREHARARSRRGRGRHELLRGRQVGERLVASAAVPGRAREKRGSLAGGLAVAGLDQRVAGFFERSLTALVSGQMERVRPPEEQVGPLV